MLSAPPCNVTRGMHLLHHSNWIVTSLFPLQLCILAYVGLEYLLLNKGTTQKHRARRNMRCPLIYPLNPGQVQLDLRSHILTYLSTLTYS